jgi:hypothetical protein
LGAHAVYSRDPHLRRMNVPVIWVQLDLTVRDYARANAVCLTINFGTSYSVMLGFVAFMGFAKASQACLRALKRLPTGVKVIIAAGVLLAIVHPKLRAKMANAFQSIRSHLDDLKPLLGEALGNLMIQSALADRTAKSTGAEIRAILPPTRKLPAVVRARAICLLSKEPLSLQEIEKRMRKEGYATKSKNFRAYLRRVLQKDQRFVEVSAGYWTIKAERLAASA